MIRLSTILVTVVMMLPTAGPTALAEEIVYRLQTDHILCIKNNIEQYLGLPGDEFLIAVSSCPNIPENPLMDALVNEGPTIEFAGEDAPDSLIVVTREQLECLAGKPVEASLAIHRYFPEDCRLEPEDE